MFFCLGFTCTLASCFLVSILGVDDHLNLELEFDWDQDPTMIEGWGFEEANPSCHEVNSRHQHSASFGDHSEEAIVSTTAFVSPSVKPFGASNSQQLEVLDGKNRANGHHLLYLGERPLIHRQHVRKSRGEEEAFEKRKKAKFPAIQMMGQLGNVAFPSLGQLHQRDSTHIFSALHPDISPDRSSNKHKVWGQNHNLQNNHKDGIFRDQIHDPFLSSSNHVPSVSNNDPGVPSNESAFNEGHQTHIKDSTTRQVPVAKALGKISERGADETNLQEADPEIYRFLGFFSDPTRKSYWDQLPPLEKKILVQLKRLGSFYGLEVEIKGSDWVKEIEFGMKAELLVKTVSYLNEKILKVFSFNKKDKTNNPSVSSIFKWLFEQTSPTKAGDKTKKNLTTGQVNRLRELFVEGLTQPVRKKYPHVFKEDLIPQNFAKEFLFTTKAGVHILGTFYKSLNGSKFRAVFPYDMDFIKLLLTLRFQSLEGHGSSYMRNKSDMVSRAHLIPWESEWPPEVANSFQNQSPFKSSFVKTTRCLVTSLEISFNRRAAQALQDHDAKEKERFEVQEANKFNNFDRNVHLSFEVADHRVYGWIGSMADVFDHQAHLIMAPIKKKLLKNVDQAPTIPTSDSDLKILEEVLEHGLTRVYSFQLQNKGSQLKTEHHFIEKELKKKILEKVVLLIHKLYSLNKRFIQVFNISTSEEIYQAEQKAFFDWLEKNIFLLTGWQYHEVTFETSENLQWQKVQQKILSYLTLQKNQDVMVIKTSNGKEYETIDKELERKTEAAFHILIFYLKSTNLSKWKAIFHCDIDSVKLMSLWKLQINNKRKERIKFKKSIFFQSSNPIPWSNPWDAQKVSLAIELNPFKDCFMHSELYWMREIETQALF